MMTKKRVPFIYSTLKYPYKTSEKIYSVLVVFLLLDFDPPASFSGSASSSPALSALKSEKSVSSLPFNESFNSLIPINNAIAPPKINKTGRVAANAFKKKDHQIISPIAPKHIAMMPPIVLPTNANLLEALRDFGARDVESLPVESEQGKARRLVGLLLRSDVMRRYREGMLRRD